MVEPGAVPADRLSQSLHSGGAGPRPPGTKARALGASSRRAETPVRGERGPDAVTDTAVERRRACAFSKRKGAPWPQGHGSRKLARPPGAPLPLVLAGSRKRRRRPRAAKNRGGGALAKPCAHPRESGDPAKN